MSSLRRWEWGIIGVMVLAGIVAAVLISRGGKPAEVVDVPVARPRPPTSALPTEGSGPPAVPAAHKEVSPAGPPGGERPASGDAVSPEEMKRLVRREMERERRATQRHDAPPPVGLPARCPDRLQQVATGLRMYFVDYDERMPPASRWCTVIDPYLRSPDFLRCPSFSNPYGYALNSTLDGIRLPQAIDSASTVGFFDSSAARANAADAGRSLCRPPRHPEGNYTAYLDGHAKAGDPPSGFGIVSPHVRHAPRDGGAH